jgi:hypothetical protein
MVIELSGSVFEITHDLVSDLFRAKNAGVTKVLVKRTLSLLPPSMSTLLSLEPATTGFRTSGKHPGLEKLVY